MSARVYISRSFLQLPSPVCGHAEAVARSGSAAHPCQDSEGGSGGAVVVVANAGAVPCGHSLPHKASGLALLWTRARSSGKRRRHFLRVCQELPRFRGFSSAPGEAVTGASLPARGGILCSQAVPAAATARAEGGWCLCIYLRTKV